MALLFEFESVGVNFRQLDKLYKYALDSHVPIYFFNK